MKPTNRYRYEMVYDETVDENGNVSFLSHNTFLYACHKNRDYLTKLKVGDLPEHYCDVWRYGSNHDFISAKGVKGLYYTWVKENHFMKDSLLYISYTDEIEPYNETFMWEGQELTSFFKSYRNAEEMIFGHDILKYLAYVEKYSNYDTTEVKKSVAEHFEWLNEHEPAYAPELGEFKNYTDWLENKLKNYDNKGND